MSGSCRIEAEGTSTGWLVLATGLKYLHARSSNPTLVGSPAFQVHLGLPRLLSPKLAARGLCARDRTTGYRKGPGLSASKSTATRHTHPPRHGHTNFQAVGQFISSAGLSGPLTQRPLPSYPVGLLCHHPKSLPIRDTRARVVSLLLNGHLAPGSRAGFSSASPSRARSSESSGPRPPGPQHRPGPPHRAAGILPSPSWRAVRVLTGSQGPRSAACIGLLHLYQFPVSLHLGRDQGAEGVQVTSRTAEIFPKQRELRTNLCIYVLG